MAHGGAGGAQNEKEKKKIGRLILYYNKKEVIEVVVRSI